MTIKTLVYQPSLRRVFKNSPLYAMKMFSKVIALCSKYLLTSIKRPHDVGTVETYIKHFWRLHFDESATALYVTGREQLARGETYIFMSNHESWMDIPAIFAAVPSPLRMVAKLGLMKIPIFGKAMVNAGFIIIDRKNRHRAIAQLEVAKERLREGISIWLSPEGTRTRDGMIGPFKKGGFYLAKDLGVAIVPVFIEGAAAVLPADSLMVKTNQDITVHFCQPVAANIVKEMAMPDLVNSVRNAVIDKQRELLLEKGA